MSDNEDNNKQHKRITKKGRFAEERHNTLNRMYAIIGITDINKYFYFEDIESDENKKNQLTELATDVKKYFSCGRWAYFAKSGRPNTHTSLVKSILKDMQVETERTRIMHNKVVAKSGMKIE